MHGYGTTAQGFWEAAIGQAIALLDRGARASEAAAQRIASLGSPGVLDRLLADPTSGQWTNQPLGNPGSSQPIVPRTAEYVEELARVEQPTERADLWTVTLSAGPTASSTDAIAECAIRWGSGGHMHEARIDWTQGTVFSLAAAALYVSVAVPASSETPAPAAATWGATIARGLRPSKHPTVLTRHGTIATGDAATIDVPEKATGVLLWRTDVLNTSALVQLTNFAAIIQGEAYYAPGNHAEIFLPLTRRSTRIRVQNNTPAPGASFRYSLVFQIAL